MRLIILEGARGTGKSTVSSKLRQRLKNSTLINFTGFNLDGSDGLSKIRDYYDNWFQLLRMMKWKVNDQTIICDRFFPSEMVYSTLYKQYNFEKYHETFSYLLPTLADEIHMLNFKITDPEELTLRLQRDKISFWKVKESVEETLKQQEQYSKVFAGMSKLYADGVFSQKMNISDINTTFKDPDEVFNEVWKLISE